MATRGLCQVCRASRPVVDGIRSVAYFEGPLRQAVHDFKYRGVRALAQPLAGLLVEYQRTQHLPADVVVPVPLHPQREAERGYNQAALLAEVLGDALGLPVALHLLERVRPTPPQVGLNAAERRSNVHAAFRATREAAARRVLLVDDVCTTGATLNACGAALKAQGARSVWGLTLARG
jgi:ComF family protein